MTIHVTESNIAVARASGISETRIREARFLDAFTHFVEPVLDRHDVDSRVILKSALLALRSCS